MSLRLDTKEDDADDPVDGEAMTPSSSSVSSQLGSEASEMLMSGRERAAGLERGT